MKLRLFALIALTGAGCVASGDETDVQCLTTCTGTATYTLATPITGREIAITVGEPDGNVLRVDCQPGAGSVACVPVASRLMPAFDTAGALQSLTLDRPFAGTTAVQIDVDGAPAAAGSFEIPVTTLPPTSTACPGPDLPTYLCSGSHQFTVAN